MDMSCFEELIRLKSDEFRNQIDTLKSYLILAQKLQTIHLIVMGKDPFPTRPTGIPFCKPTWEEQEAENGAGYFVLTSVCGSNVFEKKSLYREGPIEYFQKLCEAGVIFLNASYFLFDELENRKKAKASSYDINKPLLQKATKIILCGKAKDCLKMGELNENWKNNCIPVIHPAPRNGKSPDPERKNKWKKLWGTPGAVQKEFLSGHSASL